MRAGESWAWLNVAAGTLELPDLNHAGRTGPLVLQGGLYLMEYIGTNPTTCTLEKLGPDSSTWETVYTKLDSTDAPVAALTTSGSLGRAWVPPGQYRIVVATSTANYVSLTRIPTSE